MKGDSFLLLGSDKIKFKVIFIYLVLVERGCRT